MGRQMPERKGSGRQRRKPEATAAGIAGSGGNLSRVIPVSGLGRFEAGFKIAVQRAPGTAHKARDFGFGDIVLQQRHNSAVLLLQFAARGTVGAAEAAPFVAQALERIAGAFRNQLAFDFSGEGKGESEDFALNVCAEAVIFFQRPYLAVFFQAMLQYAHDLQHIAPQTRQFGCNQDVPLLQAAKQAAEPAFLQTFAGRYGFFDPAVNLQGRKSGEFFDFVALVCRVLAVGADANVSVYHIAIPLCFLN